MQKFKSQLSFSLPLRHRQRRYSLIFQHCTSHTISFKNRHSLFNNTFIVALSYITWMMADIKGMLANDEWMADPRMYACGRDRALLKLAAMLPHKAAVKRSWVLYQPATKPPQNVLPQPVGSKIFFTFTPLIPSVGSSLADVSSWAFSWWPNKVWKAGTSQVSFVSLLLTHF